MGRGPTTQFGGRPRCAPRIIHVPIRLEDIGGLDQVVENLALEAKRHGYQVSVVPASLAQEESNQRIARLRRAGVGVHVFGRRATRLATRILLSAAWLCSVLVLPYGLYRWRGLRSAWGRVRQEAAWELCTRPLRRGCQLWLWHVLSKLTVPGETVLHVHDLGPQTAPVFHWAARHRVSVILHWHHAMDERVFRSCTRGLAPEDLSAVRAGCTLVVLAARFIEPARRHFGPNVRVVALPNWVESPPPWAQCDLRKRERVVVGTAGRLLPNKGIQDVIKAVGLLRREGYDIALRIAGEGYLRRRLELLAQRSGCADAVQFMGAVPAAGMPGFWAETDIAVLASRSEGLPMTVLEAMAAGRAMVVSAVGGVPEMVEAETSALLVPPRDARALARALKRLAQDHELRQRLGRAAREQFKRRYTREVVWPRVEVLYESLLSRDRAPAVQ